MTDGTKKPSGAEYRRRRRALEAAMGAAPAFDDETRAEFERLGPPPLGDPFKLTVWQQSATGIVGWTFARGAVTPRAALHLRGILESVRTGGMVAVKAQERARQIEIAKRIGAAPTEGDDGLDELPAEAPNPNNRPSTDGKKT